MEIINLDNYEENDDETSIDTFSNFLIRRKSTKFFSFVLQLVLKLSLKTMMLTRFINISMKISILVQHFMRKRLKTLARNHFNRIKSMKNVQYWFLFIMINLSLVMYFIHKFLRKKKLFST